MWYLKAIILHVFGIQFDQLLGGYTYENFNLRMHACDFCGEFFVCSQNGRCICSKVIIIVSVFLFRTMPTSNSISINHMVAFSYELEISIQIQNLQMCNASQLDKIHGYHQSYQ